MVGYLHGKMHEVVKILTGSVWIQIKCKERHLEYFERAHVLDPRFLSLGL